MHNKLILETPKYINKEHINYLKCFLGKIAQFSHMYSCLYYSRCVFHLHSMGLFYLRNRAYSFKCFSSQIRAISLGNLIKLIFITP